VRTTSFCSFCMHRVMDQTSDRIQDKPDELRKQIGKILQGKIGNVNVFLQRNGVSNQNVINRYQLLQLG